MNSPRLSFFNEQSSNDFARLVRDGRVGRDLSQLGARVIVGLLDLSEERAESMLQLADSGVELGGWLLVDREHGYFATHDNNNAVEARVEAVLAWVERYDLPVRSLGFDFEPDLRELELFFAQPFTSLRRWANRAKDRSRRETAHQAYSSLFSRLKSQGWRVDSYQFPLLLEDRASGSQFFQRFMGALDVASDREVVMAYSSLLGPLGVGLIHQWAGEGARLAVGSTGGGVDPFPKLRFEELSRDLRIAARMTNDVSIFSLEGCVAQGFLPRLQDLDWSQHVDVPTLQRVGAAALRGTARVLARAFR